MELQRCRENNEKILKAQEDQNQINAAILQSLTNIHGQINVDVYVTSDCIYLCILCIVT